METAPPPGEGTPLDRGLRALCGIAAYYRIGADPVQLARELALGAREANEGDLIRAAKLVGMRARLVEKVTAERLATLPTPAIVRMASGAFMVFGGRNPSGLCRLVDPISHAVQEATLEDLARDIGGQALLVARQIGGAGVDPRQFGMRWFLPTIWRYRRPLGHVLAASLFVQIFALTTPLFFQVVVDKVLTHRGYETLFVLVGGLVAIGIVRRGAAIPAHLRAVAHHKSDRRRARPTPVRASSPPADFLFRDPFDRANRRPGAGTGDDPQLPHRTGFVLGARPRVRLRVRRRSLRLFVVADPDRARRHSVLRGDRLFRAAALTRTGQGEIQSRRGEPAVPGRDDRRREHGEERGGRADHARAMGGKTRGLRQDELRRRDAGLWRAARHPVHQQADDGGAASVRRQGGDRRRADCRRRSSPST